MLRRLGINLIVRLVTIKVPGVIRLFGRISRTHLQIFFSSPLLVVEVAVGRRTHDDIESHFGSLDAALSPSPGHYCGAFLQVTLQNLIPSDNLAAFACKVVLHAPRHIVLQPLFLGRAVAVLEA